MAKPSRKNKVPPRLPTAAEIDAKTEDTKKRLLSVAETRINAAGHVLGEVLDHVKAGEGGLAEIGALSEVAIEINHAINVLAFRVRAGELKPQSEIITPPEGILLPG